LEPIGTIIKKCLLIRSQEPGMPTPFAKPFLILPFKRDRYKGLKEISKRE